MIMVMMIMTTMAVRDVQLNMGCKSWWGVWYFSHSQSFIFARGQGLGSNAGMFTLNVTIFKSKVIG